MRYLYGAADEKHVRVQKSEQFFMFPNMKNVKKHENPLDSYRFRLDPSLRGKPKINRHEASIRYKVTPDTLVELASTKVNALPLPLPFTWSKHDSGDWIRKLGFPEYQNTIKKNFVDGHDLITMDASNLVKLNIKKFDHIKIITKAIRHMYGFERSSFSRSVSLPDRPPGAQYEFYRVRNGPKYDKTRRTDLFRTRKLLRPPPLYETHWQTLERWLSHRRPVETELFGAYRRNKDYMFHPPKRLHAPIVSKKPVSCECMPPCMCHWTERDLKPKYEWTYLKKIAKHPVRSANCTCTQPCTCGWPFYQRLLCLSILQRHMPHKYGYSDQPRRSFHLESRMPVGIRASVKSM